MNPEDIKALIDQLLKTGELLATKAFLISIKQVISYGILDISFGIFFVLFGTVLYVLGTRKNWDEDFIYPVSLISFFGGIFLIIASTRFFMNPEWYAMNMMIDMIR